MSKKRLLIAVLVGALVAVGAAVPVIAQIMGKPAESGYVRMYHYVNVDDGNDNWEATGTSSVRLTYDTKVDPYSASLLLVGTRLERKTEYSLVNVTDYGYDEATDPDEYWVDVNVLGTATSNKAGMVTIKARTDELVEAWVMDEEGDSISAFSRFSGADLWLVPSDAVQSDVDHPEYGDWIDLEVVDGIPVPNCDFIYASLGLPVEWDDVFEPYLWDENP